MIIVTVLRDKLIHSETIRENQTIKSDHSDDSWWLRFRVQFTLPSVNDTLRTINALFTKVKSNESNQSSVQSPRQISEKSISVYQINVLFSFHFYLTGLKVNWAPKLQWQ